MDFFSKCDQIRRPADLITFTEEILNGKPHFCTVKVLKFVSNFHFPCSFIVDVHTKY